SKARTGRVGVGELGSSGYGGENNRISKDGELVSRKKGVLEMEYKFEGPTRGEGGTAEVVQLERRDMSSRDEQADFDCRE
ncbi:hypothetical protein Leryth_003142, partial [Lithospermum erythrorhizon]